MSILVAGGNGRLGRAVLAQLGQNGRAAVRHRGTAGAIFIDSDGNVDPADLAGVTAIVNCVNLVHGTTADINRANVAYPRVLARAAREAGVQRFVQVSSFSIYGRAERIDAATPLAPESDYGRSKLVAESELAALATPNFSVVALRLPFMFSLEEPALMGRLVPLIQKLHFVPVRAGIPVQRSMITYAGAAEALLCALHSDSQDGAGTVVAADPRPLELGDIGQALRARGHRVATLPVPKFAIVAARRVVPGIVDRLFRSNILAHDINMMRDGTAYPVTAELAAYIEEWNRGRAGHAEES
ncbi:NAD-dependent epimerase/dehydratase family protein [Sphingomonas sanguinis]|uniref:NAD-dependent epimerase/dehydratase domain-containing protein n=1 Tax=Sphingomonas sanguinis TaxID=33051 RepID=A0A147HWE9_9SPHN|nr:NAD-dependent epimerase/dehydratase family protein [Sphingomonas sanguinis]KTT69246.1 hypothetical protein NS319_10940 [Sphingomonas sanguinis]